MKAKKTAKRVNWPPRLTAKRKRALALMEEWASQDVDVEYASHGLIFTGSISLFSYDDRKTSFLFVTGAGIHASLSTDLYEHVEINDFLETQTTVAFNRKDFSSGFSLTRKAKKSSEDDLAKAYDLFRQWEKFDMQLSVHAGDAMRITISSGKVKEVSGHFLFTIGDTKTAHVVVPKRSSLINIETEGDQTSITLYNERSGLYFTVTNRIESTKEIMDRFVVQTTRVQ